MTGTEHYSTLELDPIQNNSNERHEEDSRVGPEVWRDAPGRHLEAQYLHPVTLPPEYKAGDVQVPQVQETICGISRRRFYIVLSIAVLIVIGAIAGGVGGGLAASHRSTTTHANTTNANTSSIQILSTSKLAATTMFSIHNTDSQSIRYVAFQDAQGALIVRKYDSLAGNWTTINMTTYFATSTTPVKIMPGTPLAATSCNSWNCKNSAIYFLNANNSMGSVVDRPATTPVFWEYQPIENSSATWNGSQLAAAYKNSNKPNTVGSFDVAYQSSDGAITVVNLQDSTSTEVIATRFATSNTSLALMSQYNENRTFLSDLTILAELNSELYSGREQLRYYNQDADSWADNTTVSGEIPLPSSSQQFAVMALNNYTDYLYLISLPNSVISGQWVTGNSTTSTDNMTLSGGGNDQFFGHRRDLGYILWDFQRSGPTVFYQTALTRFGIRLRAVSGTG